MFSVEEVFYYPGFEGWLFATRYQCLVTGADTFYARSEKHLARILKKHDIEMPELTKPRWTGFSNQHLVYDREGKLVDALEVLKERYGG